MGIVLDFGIFAYMFACQMDLQWDFISWQIMEKKNSSPSTHKYDAFSQGVNTSDTYFPFAQHF